MNKVSASAPGKIVICGEYAVLFGAAAVCMAVTRRAHVSVERNAHHHVLETQGVVSGTRVFHVDADGSFSWPDSGRSSLLEAVWREWRLRDVPPLRLHIDSSEFRDASSGAKYGFGSSAAVCVALCAALSSLGRRTETISSAAATAHRNSQGGRGSGIDVAASQQGGLIRYLMKEPLKPDALRWPSDLHYRVLWSGKPADTTGRIARFEERAQQESVDGRLLESANAIAQDWPDASPDDLLHAMRRYIDALVEFDAAHDLGIFEAGHRELLEVSHNMDVVYKPCGAGGGDVGIAMTGGQPERLDEFVAQAAKLGFRCLDVSMDVDGVVSRQGPA